MQHVFCGASLTALPGAPQAEASGDSKKDSPGSLAATSSADAVKVQHKGRFEVYDSDASASSEVRARRAPRAMPGVAAVSHRCCAAQGTKVRKGRFMVEESSDGDSVRAACQR